MKALLTVFVLASSLASSFAAASTCSQGKIARLDGKLLLLIPNGRYFEITNPEGLRGGDAGAFELTFPINPNLDATPYLSVKRVLLCP